MKLLRLPALLVLLYCLCAALSGCASSTPRMQQVREFAAASATLGGYGELSERFRDTYRREQPYLSPAADAREQQLDVRRQAATADFISIGRGVQLYLRALGTLAGDNQYDLEDQVKAMSGAIKAWPDSGLDDRHVNAYAGLSRLLLRAISGNEQDRSVQTLLRASRDDLPALLDAMRALLRYYDKSNDNERAIVLGVLEVEVPFADQPPNRLLATLAKVHLKDKRTEYGLVGRRLTLAQHNLEAIAQGHQALLQQLDPAAPAGDAGAHRTASTEASLQQAIAALRADNAAMATSFCSPSQGE